MCSGHNAFIGMKNNGTRKTALLRKEPQPQYLLAGKLFYGKPL